jgi:hypothetical protein
MASPAISKAANSSRATKPIVRPISTSRATST